MQLTIELQHRVEQRGQVRQVGRHVLACSMEQLFQSTHPGQHRQDRLQQHPFIPRPFGTQLEILRDPFGTVKSGVGQRDRVAFKACHHWQERLVMDVGRVPIPGDHLAATVGQPAELDAHDPTMIGQALFAQLLGTTALTPGVDQLDAVTVDDGEEGGISQEGFTPVPVGRQQPLQPGAMRQVEPIAIVTFQPAVESSERDTFERKEQADGDQLAGVETRLGMFRQMTDAVVYQTEEMYDKIQGSHGFRPSNSVFLFLNVDEAHDFFN